MSNLEHYFENLLYYGEDIKGEANKNALTEEQQKSVEQCAQYVIYSLFKTREHFDEWINREPASPWHRVEKEMPDLLQFVVVCNDEGKCVVAQYVGYQTDSLTPWRIAYTMYDTDIYDEKECGPVRYWMPIEPPKEDA